MYNSILSLATCSGGVGVLTKTEIDFHKHLQCNKADFSQKYEQLPAEW